MDKSASKTAKFINKLATKFEITKSKVLVSLLTGFTVPFLLLICSTFNVYFSNAEEFGFSVGDFAPFFISVSAVAFVLITIALIFTKKWLHNLIFSLCGGLIICAYIQTIVTNLTFTGLPGDGNAAPPSKLRIIVGLLLWFAVFATIIWFCVISSKATTAKKVVSFLLIIILVSQLLTFIPSAIIFGTDSAKKTPTQMYLSNKNIYEVSKNKNIFVFVLDRFDAEYYEELAEKYPEVIAELDGFTYYDDNISKYPRTYPAITYMLTGVENDFSVKRLEYFEKAYSTSTFLKDLKDNNYKTNLYIPIYYAYSDAKVLSDYASNTSHFDGHSISDPAQFTKNMIRLSSYFWLPDKFKSQSISSNKFFESVVYEGDAPEYTVDSSSDSIVYTELMNDGLRIQSEQNTFTFMHLNGCHPPYTIDENCTYREDGTIKPVEQTRGSFAILCEYIKQLKSMGLYEDATIIITGDHAALTTDYEAYDSPKLTALLVKESGKSGTSIATSHAPVSQDNLLATIVKSAGIKTTTDYGRACSEIAEDEILTRVHFFQKVNVSTRKNTNITYEITGSAKDFNNWKITATEEDNH